MLACSYNFICIENINILILLHLDMIGSVVSIHMLLLYIRTIPCQGPPELVNWNFSILSFLSQRSFFQKIFPKTLKFLFSKICFDYFHYIIMDFFCVYKRIKVVFVPGVTLLNVNVNLKNLMGSWNSIP